MVLAGFLLFTRTLAAAEGAGSVQPAGDEPARIYSSPEERRDAGLGRKLTEWLTVSGLLEVETERQEIDFSGNVSDVDNEETAETLQLGLVFTLSDMVNAEFVIDYEAEIDHLELDEGVINLEGATWTVSAGRLYVPFGEYHSHFVTGPLLEFGETRSSAALAADYSPIDTFEILVYAFGGDTGKTGRSRNAVDWGVGFELNSLDESLKFGAGYLSDLAESDALLLDDFDSRYENRVGGWNIHALLGMEPFEITIEAVAAAGHFRELDAGEDKPRAANLELAWFPRPTIQLATRVERSEELADEPKWQYGISAAWRIGRYISIAMDYLYGEYRNDFVFDDDDNELDQRNLFAAQFALEF